MTILWLLVAALGTGAVVVLAQQGDEDWRVNQRGFADALTAALYDTAASEFTSALGVSMAFSLVYPSMTGDALNQTQAVLGYPDTATNDTAGLVWADTQSQLEATYVGTCVLTGGGADEECTLAEPTIVISNVIWVDDGSTVDPDYAAVVGDSLEQIDFQDPGAGDLVNAWVSNATRGLIENLVNPGPLSDLALLAVNAIYLKGNWLNIFEPSDTNQDIFYTSASRTTPTDEEANFMHQVEYFPYSDQAIPGFEIVKLPFVGETLSMVIALPLSDESGVLTSSDLIGSGLPQLEIQRLAIALPKFELALEYQDSLKTALQTLGIVAPFSGGLCIFENDCSSAIDVIIQKTFIRVKEEGVEAAAVTGILIGVSLPTDQPIVVLVDHPFQFFIYEEETQLVLFEGQMANPGLLDNSTELAARHSESDFWTSNFGVEPITDDSEPTPSPVATNSTLPTASPSAENLNSPTESPAAANATVSAPGAPAPTSSTLARLRSFLPLTIVCLIGMVLLQH